MTLLSIIQDAAINLGLTKPTVVIGSTDQQTQELLGSLNTEGQMLCRETPILPQLMRQMSWTTIAADLQGSLATIAPDYGYMTHDTAWDRNMMWPITGPLSPQQWQFLKSRAVQGPNYRYRIKMNPDTNENSLYLIPSPPAGETFYAEYVSSHWVANATRDTTYSKFSNADTDVGLINEFLLQLGTEWRWLKTKGFPNWSEKKLEYDTFKANLFGQDPGSTSFMITPALPDGRWFYYANIQDGNFPAT